MLGKRNPTNSKGRLEKEFFERWMKERSISASYLVFYWDVTEDGEQEAEISLSTAVFCLNASKSESQEMQLKKKVQKLGVCI